VEVSIVGACRKQDVDNVEGAAAQSRLQQEGNSSAFATTQV
jgi:hypothetical protein